MTDIEKKALALLNEVWAERGRTVPLDRFSRDNFTISEALCRAIERHEAFRQEVSDAVEAYNDLWRKRTPGRDEFMGHFIRFIIAKPDPLVEIIATALLEGSPFYEDGSHNYMGEAKVVAAAIEKRGGKIVWGEAR
jgi:hypothetical protein